MSLELEFSRLERGQLTQAVEETDTDRASALEEVVARYRVLSDIRRFVLRAEGLLPPGTNLTMADTAAVVVCLGVAESADAHQDVSLLSSLNEGEAVATLHEELGTLTYGNTMRGLSKTLEAPLWRAPQSEANAFLDSFPALHELIVVSAGRLTESNLVKVTHFEHPLYSVNDLLSYVNGGLTTAQMLIETSRAGNFSTGLGEETIE